MMSNINRYHHLHKRMIFVCLFLLWGISVIAQTITVKGTVKDAMGEPIIGANILQTGTSNGTTSDLDGNFLINVPKDALLKITYVGYKEKTVSATNPLIIVLDEDNEALDEVVVIGYGIQKKSVVTAAIAQVGQKELQRVAPVRVDNALKGLAAGVTVTSASGQPGEGSRIRIRGVGTINNSDPLYIVDGMPIDGGIDFLNPGDIASIEVLKDAASGAVYGARAANGVILVTTKSGTAGRTNVTYDFSYSLQNPWKEKSVLNATEYALLMNEGYLNSGMAPKYNDPYSFGSGTNWQKELFNYNAPMQSHQLSISGAGEKTNYYLSLGYFKQEGIVGGDYDRSNYDRLTIRSNSLHNLFETKERNWLNKIQLGVNASFAYVKSKGITTNSEFGSPLGSALALAPTIPVYAEDEEATLAEYAGITDFTPVYSADGRLYSIAGPDYNEITNPLAQLSLPGTTGWSYKLVSNFFAEIQIWDNLKFRSSFGSDLAFYGNDGWTKKYYLTANNKAPRSSAQSEMSRGFVWQWENILSYDKTFGGNYISVMLGQSAKETTGRTVGAFNYDLIEEDPDKGNLGFTSGIRENGDMNAWGYVHAPHTMASYFGRASYNYNERYMAQVTVRRDGSSNFGPKNKWAVFPSFSLGWNITNEKFMEKRPEWISGIKLRGSWGRNGNESIGAFKYMALSSPGNNYQFGSDSKITIGTKPSILANKAIRWEESEQTDVAMDFFLLNNALNFTVDYYQKRTNGMLIEMPIPNYVGEAKPWGNVGKMKNEGVEFEISYRFKTGDVNFRVGGNASYLKNTLINYGNESGYQNLDAIQGLGTITRATNGLPFPYFYGLKTNGLFQNMDEVRNYTTGDGLMIMPEAVPGDVRFVDLNGDGKIDENDKTILGKGMPDWTYGININVDWKGLDFSMLWQGTAGNQVYDATRRTDISGINLPAYMLNRWTGEGTSNSIPRFVIGDKVNWQSSDLYVKNGTYIRLKNIQLGYTIPANITRKALIQNLRVYLAAENLLTFTKYDGFDPEISSGGTSLGVDRGIYPQAKVYTIGLNLSF
ncbi:MAG: SusC/RagA family TonB-linked outer membrane protein [Bacteroidales bacterium]